MADRHGPCTKLHWGYRCTREDGHSGICHLDPEGCICGLNDPRCEGATCVLEPNELARSGADVPGLEPGETGRRIAAGVESCPARLTMERRLNLFRRHYAVARLYANRRTAAWIALRFSAADGRGRWDMDGVFQTKAVGATLLTGIACCVAVLLGVNALPALAGTAALFCVVTTWGGTR